MGAIDKKTKSSLGIGLLAVIVVALVSMPVMAVRAVIMSLRSSRISGKAGDAVALWERKKTPPETPVYDVAANVNKMFILPSKQKAPALLGIWGSTCIFSKGADNAQVCEVGDKIGVFTVASIEDITVTLQGENGPLKVSIAPYKPPKGWKPKTKAKTTGAKKTATAPKPATPAQTARPRFPGGMSPEMRRRLIEAMRQRRASRGSSRSGSRNRRRR